MDKINGAISEEEYVNMIVELRNEDEGTLTGYNCPKCKNKGYFWIVKDLKPLLVDCECKSVRKVLKDFEGSGISKEMFNHYSFDTYKTDRDYQQVILAKAKKYVDDIKSGTHKWFYFGGISGIGKTHICTAIVKSLLESGMSCKYFLWKNELPKLRSMRKSFDEGTQKEYYNKISTYSNVDVLYIDDFLKFLDTRNNDDLDIAYEILNTRYCNDKITIISSELDKEELSKVDLAISGRIIEKSKDYFVQPLKSLDRNYRLQ